MILINWFGMVAFGVLALLFTGVAYLYKKNIDFGLLNIIGMILGILFGIVFKGNLEYVSFLGTIYTKIIVAIVAPLIIFSILSSLTSLDNIQKLKKIGFKSVFWLLLSTFIAIVLSLGIGLLSGVGKNVSVVLNSIDASSLSKKATTLTQVITNFFPSNIISDIQNNSIIPLIIFAITLSIAYVLISDRNREKVLPFKFFVDSTKEILYKVVEFIVVLSPYAVTVLVASAVSKATDAISSILPLLFLLIITYVVCAIQTYLVGGILIAAVAKLNPVKFFRKISGAQATAFTIQSSVGTLPVTINNLTKKVGVSDEVANFTAPLGTTIGMPGCAGVWPILLSVFAINALNLNYTIGQYVTLVIIALAVSLGTAGVPGTATVTATAVFTAAGLPVEVIILLLPISTIADMARTATNVTAAAIAATLTAKQENQINLSIFSGEKTYEEVEFDKKAALEMEPVF